MIEYRFIDLFKTLPSVNGYKPNYDFGTEKDKDKFLQVKRAEGVPFYPLIWLETPISSTGYTYKEAPIKLLIATLNQNVDMNNRVRIEKVINPFIIPVRDNVYRAIQKSGFSKIIDRDNIVETLYYNYGGDEGTTTDIWDVLKIEMKVEFSECEQKTINY